MVKADPHWQTIGRRAHHGICLPLFALHTKKGEARFLDLIPLIDWCKQIGFDCIQLLPLNDTGSDLSPYNPMSAFALHSRYADLSQPIKEDAYLAFVANNPWLKAYCRFKTLKQRFKGVHWELWPASYEEPKPSELEPYARAQFLCFEQMAQVRAHATAQGVFLQGDIPTLVSPDSADVWDAPDLFRCDLEAGALPDAYNALGQHWGFPPLRWELAQSFAWYRQRLQIAERLFHLYRIDHVVGLFRLWCIPKGLQPLDGAFLPADPALWWSQGRRILEMMLDATSMLPIAEDLGIIPKELAPILKDLGICSTKVIRWQRRWEGDRSYIPFDEYEPLSMTTLSTPDMEPLEIWWKERPDESVPLASFMQWPYHPILSHQQKLQLLQAAHRTTSFFHINLLHEYLGLFPELIHPDPRQGRINVPGTVSPTNWTYRFRPTLEEIVQHPGLRQAMISCST